MQLQLSLVAAANKYLQELLPVLCAVCIRSCICLEQTDFSSCAKVQTKCCHEGRSCLLLILALPD